MSATIAMSITEGRTVRDLFEHGLLDMLRDGGAEIAIFTEAVTVPGFVERWGGPGISFEPFTPAASTRARGRAYRLRRHVAKAGTTVFQAYLRTEQHRLYRPPARYTEALRRLQPSVYLSTHAHLWDETELLAAARDLDIPTIGLIRSWDNVHKGISARPDRVLVWNEINRQELLDLEHYEADQVEVIGAPQFDTYFDATARWTREEFAERFDLDPARPIIVFATLGQFFPWFDETSWMDAILDLLDAAVLPGRPQVICRLHPWSRMEQFHRYAEHPDVRLSVIERYWPTLQWTMSREDMIEVMNMLTHAEVVITPGSTMTLEAAIFDRPTLVPTFHRYQPERVKAHFETWVLGKHFSRIADLGLVPFIDDEADFAAAVTRCLEEPMWFAEGRQRLVSDYVVFTDGASTRRLADRLLAEV